MKNNWFTLPYRVSWNNRSHNELLITESYFIDQYQADQFIAYLETNRIPKHWALFCEEQLLKKSWN